MRMDKRGRVMVAASPRERDGTKAILFLLGILAIMAAMILGQIQNAHAETEESVPDDIEVEELESGLDGIEEDTPPEPALVSTNGTNGEVALVPFAAFLVGEDALPAGTYFFPDATKLGGEAGGKGEIPETSQEGPGPGFPVQFAMKCSFHVAAKAGIVNCEDGIVKRMLKGRILGLPFVRLETDVDGAQHVYVVLVLKSLSIPGHTYVAEIEGGEKEVDVKLGDPEGKRAVNVEDVALKFVHLPKG